MLGLLESLVVPEDWGVLGVGEVLVVVVVVEDVGEAATPRLWR